MLAENSDLLHGGENGGGGRSSYLLMPISPLIFIISLANPAESKRKNSF